MRIVHVVARLNVGGTARWLDTLVAGQLGAGHEVTVLAGDVQPGEAEDPGAGALPLLRLPLLGRRVDPADDLRALAAIRRVVADLRPDVVATHTAKAGLLGRLAALTAGSPARRPRRRRPAVVHTVHGHLLHGYFGRAGTAAVAASERALLAATDLVLAVGETVRAELVAARVASADRVVAVFPGLPDRPDGPPDAARRAIARAALGLGAGPGGDPGSDPGTGPGDDPGTSPGGDPGTGPGAGPGQDGDAVVAGWLARVVRVKRPDRLLGAAARTPGVTYLAGGDGPLREELARRAEELRRPHGTAGGTAPAAASTPRPTGRTAEVTDCGADVRVLGWQAPATFWDACDLAVLTSDNEGMPTALVEAALAGLPAVATAVGSAGEVVVDGVTGLVVPPTAGAVAAAVAALAADPALRAALGAAARARALSEFSPERMLAAHEAAYARALSRARR